MNKNINVDLIQKLFKIKRLYKYKNNISFINNSNNWNIITKKKYKNIIKKKIIQFKENKTIRNFIVNKFVYYIKLIDENFIILNKNNFSCTNIYHKYPLYNVTKVEEICNHLKLEIDYSFIIILNVKTYKKLKFKFLKEYDIMTNFIKLKTFYKWEINHKKCLLIKKINNIFINVKNNDFGNNIVDMYEYKNFFINLINYSFFKIYYNPSFNELIFKNSRITEYKIFKKYFIFQLNNINYIVLSLKTMKQVKLKKKLMIVLQIFLSLKIIYILKLIVL